ncbi:hypothetical protein TNCV_784361 [Trichonephila clavipes]|nr:hypothetical protein TNCV_784361 [Trichonephila clavipes]
MTTLQQKVQCVLWLMEFKSVTLVQRRVRTEWNVDPPKSKSTHLWVVPNSGWIVMSIHQCERTLLSYWWIDFYVGGSTYQGSRL